MKRVFGVLALFGLFMLLLIMPLFMMNGVSADECSVEVLPTPTSLPALFAPGVHAAKGEADPLSCDNQAGAPAFDDNRLNQRSGDAAAPLAVFCNESGGYDVYWINETANGDLVIRLVERQIEEGDGLIEDADVPGGAIEVYKLEDGSLQANFGDYTFGWNGCEIVY